jgi:hypothetical protein
MRITGKYCMEDIQMSISTIISKQIDTGEDNPRHPHALTFERLGLLFESPKWFKVDTVINLLSTVNYADLTSTDLVPLQQQLDVMATIIVYGGRLEPRESL